MQKIRVCPKCGKTEGEFTYFCTECGARTELKEGGDDGLHQRSVPNNAVSQDNKEKRTVSNNQHESQKRDNSFKDNKTSDDSVPLGKDVNSGKKVADHRNSSEPHNNAGTSFANNKRLIMAVGVFFVIAGLAAGVMVSINTGKKRTAAENYPSREEQDIGQTVVERDDETGGITVSDIGNDVETDMENTHYEVLSDTQYGETEPADGAEPVDGVESEVSIIREEYNGIMRDISDGKLQENVIGSGVTSYSRNGEVKAVFVGKGTDNNEFSRKYFYDNGYLIFAYIEGKDANRLYFKNDRLFRWRYSPNALDPQNAINYDEEYTDGFIELENYALNEGYRYANVDVVSDTTPDTTPDTASNTTSDYILPYSDSRYLSKSDLTGLSKEECRLARNELYARHGRKFEDEELMRYFMQFDWYTPRIEPKDFAESMLNEYEIKNRDLIVEYEKEVGYR